MNIDLETLLKGGRIIKPVDIVAHKDNNKIFDVIFEIAGKKVTVKSVDGSFDEEDTFGKIFSETREEERAFQKALGFIRGITTMLNKLDKHGITITGTIGQKENK